jgi:hypothetical protein
MDGVRGVVAGVDRLLEALGGAQDAVAQGPDLLDGDGADQGAAAPGSQVGRAAS